MLFLSDDWVTKKAEICTVCKLPKFAKIDFQTNALLSHFFQNFEKLIRFSKSAHQIALGKCVEQKFEAEILKMGHPIGHDQ